MLELQIVNIKNLICDDTFFQLLDTIESTKKKRIYKMIFDEDKKHLLIGELLLKVMIFQVFNLKPEDYANSSTGL